MLEKTLESPLDCKEIQPVHSEGDQPWDFFGRNDAKAETTVLWPPHVKIWLTGKDPDSGRDWGQEEKGMTEDEMARWHHRLNGHEFEWSPGAGDGQGGLVCCDSWGRKELDMTELNWTESYCMGAYLVAQLVKNLPAMRETWVWSLGWEDPLDKGKATHSSTLAWRIPWTVHGVAKSRTQLSDFHFTFPSRTGASSVLFTPVAQCLEQYLTQEGAQVFVERIIHFWMNSFLILKLFIFNEFWVHLKILSSFQNSILNSKIHFWINYSFLLFKTEWQAILEVWVNISRYLTYLLIAQEYFLILVLILKIIR